MLHMGATTRGGGLNGKPKDQWLDWAAFRKQLQAPEPGNQHSWTHKWRGLTAKAKLRATVQARGRVRRSRFWLAVVLATFLFPTATGTWTAPLDFTRHCRSLIGDICVGDDLPYVPVLALEVEPASLMTVVDLAIRP